MGERVGSKEARQFFLASLKDEEIDKRSSISPLPFAFSWKEYLSLYPYAVSLVGCARKKEKELKELDLWISVELQKEHNYLKADAVSKVVQWKLLRGKARPLQKLVDSNNNETVKKFSEAAFHYVETGDWRKAMESLINLKGIGIASASAILAPFAEKTIPFMADEVIEAVGETRRYDIGTYSKMRSKLVAKATELGEKSWTAEQVVSNL